MRRISPTSHPHVDVAVARFSHSHKLVLIIVDTGSGRFDYDRDIGYIEAVRGGSAASIFSNFTCRQSLNGGVIGKWVGLFDDFVPCQSTHYSIESVPY